jgi:hypothetical protein
MILFDLRRLVVWSRKCIRTYIELRIFHMRVDKIGLRKNID